MADNENTQGAAQEGAEARETDQAAQDQGQDRAGAQEPPTERDPVDQVSDVQALRHEAAGRRRELRTVQAERDQLRGRVDASDRAEAERLAGARMADPSDLWSMDGVDLANFRDEDGVLVPELVAQSVSEVLERKPHWRKADRPGASPNLHQGARQEVAEAPSFGAALKAGGGR
jgi:hypothetical protein